MAPEDLLIYRNQNLKRLYLYFCWFILIHYSYYFLNVLMLISQLQFKTCREAPSKDQRPSSRRNHKTFVVGKTKPQAAREMLTPVPDDARVPDTGVGHSLSFGTNCMIAAACACTAYGLYKLFS